MSNRLGSVLTAWAALLTLAVLTLGWMVWNGAATGNDATCTPHDDASFVQGGYAPVQCGPYEPGEEVRVSFRSQEGRPLDGGNLWLHVNRADATGWIRGFALTSGWPAGKATAMCTGSAGRTYREVIPISPDTDQAIRFARDVWPKTVSPGDSLGVYVRVLDSGFEPGEEVMLTVKSPGGVLHRLPGEADAVGNVVFVVRADPGDAPGVWKGKVQGERSGHKDSIEYSVTGR